MLHCPYCGSIVKEEENFCITCGEKLPQDINLRTNHKKKFNRLWYFPIISLIIVLVGSNLFHNFLQSKSVQAKEYYELGEKSLELRDYESAKTYFSSAVEEKPNFTQGHTALEFIQKTFMIKDMLNKANEELTKGEFHSALALINDAEATIHNFDGSITTSLVDEIVEHRNTIKIEQLKHALAKNPSIDELKTLLWEADAIKSLEAVQITENIRNQIVDYAYTKASEQLSDKQFSDAQLIVDDGLKYAPNAEKLQSLKTTIEKEKVSFEITQQQRIQQALDTAAEEKEMNETDAIEVVDVQLKNDDQGNVVVIGQVKSVATIPVSSVLIEYGLLINGAEFLSNDVYVYPDTLYPNEKGNFEFIHYDMDQEVDQIDINIKKITWYTNY